MAGPRKVSPAAAMAGAQSAPPPPKKASALAQGRALIAKAFPKDESFVDIDEDSLRESRPNLTTGSIVLDYLIGGKLNRYGVRPCPGLPKKCIVNLYGQESAGKTTVALTAAVQVCKNGGSVCYIDWENAIDVSYAKTLGIPLDDPDSFLLAQPESLEKGLVILWTMAKAGVDLIVVDSVGAGVPQALLEQGVAEKGDMGRLGANAAKWSRLLPELKGVINRTGSCVLGISQLRKKIATGPGGGHGPDSDPQGGQAWKFYSEVRMGLARVSQDKGKEYNALTHKVEEALVGQTVKCRIDKCKVSASQGKAAEFYIRFGEGIDDLRSVVEIASAHGVIKKGGAWYTWERGSGGSVKGMGMDKFRDALDEDGYTELVNATIVAMSKQPGLVVADEPTDSVEAALDASELDMIMSDPLAAPAPSSDDE